MLRDDLKGWIWSKGHTCGKRHTKRCLLARAQEVWDILERDDPSRLTRQEDFSRKPLPKKILKKNPESREDLEQLGTSNLKYWIRSKGYTVSHHQTTRKPLLERAQEVWDVLEKDVPLRLTSQEDLSRKPRIKKVLEQDPQSCGDLNQTGAA
jgi:hypothetical protein